MFGSIKKNLIIRFAGCFGIFLLGAHPTRASDVRLADKSFQEIIDQYSFIGDFSEKEAVRDISTEMFWNYPFLVPLNNFPIEYDFGRGPGELPSIPGNDRAVEHLNYGRVLFEQGNIEEARKIWLSARYHYGTTYPMHRRADYLIGLAYLNISKDILKQFNYDTLKSEVRLSYSNAASFFAWAFNKKREVPDPFLDSIMPKGLYNLAAIYFDFGRYNGAHAAAEQGLNFLRQTGRKEYRSKLRRIVVEDWIKNRSYLQAVQELDTLIRQDPIPEDVAAAFTRVGDIYFDLYNYELAEEAYSLGDSIRQGLKQTLPYSYLFRAESLFWLGEFEKAEGMFSYGLAENSRQGIVSPADDTLRSWARLRIADSWLARLRKAQEAGQSQNLADIREKTMLAYYQVNREFPKTEAAKIANIRRACLGLPQYLGNNVKHAREELANFRTQNVPLAAMELGWSCEVMSYASEAKPELIDRVKAFVGQFPKSRFLFNFIDPLKDLQAKLLDDFFEKNDYFSAISFYETNRETLFAKVSSERQIKLFRAYVQTMQTEKAEAFWPEFKQAVKSGMDKVEAMVFLSEMTKKGGQKAYAIELEEWAQKLSAKPIEGVTNNTQMIEYWHRLLESNPANYSWLEKIAFSWSKADGTSDCDLWLPLISRAYDAKAQKMDWSLIYVAVEGFVRGNLPKIFTTNYSCASQALDLEKRLAESTGDGLAYARRWLERLDWPFKRIVVPFVWAASLSLEEIGDLETAKKMWKFIANQDANAFVEVNYAKFKMETFRSEVDDLWKN